MIKDKIRHIKNEILNSLQLNSEFIYLKDILESGLDEAYKQFIKAEVDWWIYEERLLRKANKSFDFNGMDDDDINSQIDDIYRSKARFEINEFGGLIEKAVELRANYLCRPLQTLTYFVFMNEPTKLFNEVILKLSYFSDYKYILDKLAEWFEENDYTDKQDKIISKSIFESAIIEIENEKISNLDFNGFEELIENLFIFFNNNADTDSYIIPVDVLIVFLEDKGLYSLTGKFNNYAGEKKLTDISKENIRDFFSNQEIIGEEPINLSDMEINDT